MFVRTRSSIIWLKIFVVSLTFVLNCDQVERHRVLTFFFDGVPPLTGETEEAALGEEETSSKDLSAAELAQRAGQVWFVHEAYNNCENCHARQRGRTYSSRGDLRALVPGLCYRCHDAYTEETGFLHGPVAVGECLFCHDPHRSKNEYLLTKPIPEQCYLCHESKQIESIANHSAESYSRCNDCHEGHASSEKSLLKKDWPGKTD